MILVRNIRLPLSCRPRPEAIVSMRTGRGRSRAAFASGESYTGPGSVPHPLQA